MKKNSLTVYRGEELRGGLSNDKKLEEILSALEKSKKTLNGLNKELAGSLGIKTGFCHKIVAKTIGGLLPKSLQNKLPMPVAKYMAEEQDILELLERLMRENINFNQDALRSLAEVAIAKHEHLEKLAKDLKIARKEKWDAKKLQEYIADNIGIEIYDEVANLLSKEFALISPEARENRKASIMLQLEENLQVGEKLMALIERVALAGLEVFHATTTYYYGYVNFYRPISVIEKSAKIMTENNSTVFASKEALKRIILESLEAISVALDASRLAGNYNVTSADMVALLDEGRMKMEKKLAEIEQGKESPVIVGGEKISKRK